MEIDLNLESLDVLNLTVRLANGSLKTYNVGEELSIDVTDLDNDFVEQPAKYAWWAVLAETAKNFKEEQEAELERVEAEADKRVRVDLELNGVKITETIVARNIKLDSDYQKQLEKSLRAKRSAMMLDRVAKAFDQRLDSLISLGANLRAENNNADVKILQTQAKDVVNKKVQQG